MGLAATSVVAGAPAGFTQEVKKVLKPALTVAHITDVHIRPQLNAPARFKECLRLVKKHKVDFILNGGDSIHAADYDDITRTRVNEQWDAWFECITDSFQCLDCPISFLYIT